MEAGFVNEEAVMLIVAIKERPVYLMLHIFCAVALHIQV
jgi:hypothetical protein